jgi:hypothetical protein
VPSTYTHLDTRPVPLISYGPEAIAFADRYEAAINQANDEHRELFAAIREATGLEPSIWQSGGMTMTIYIPLPGTTLPKGSHYLGLVEGWAENGDAAGTVSFYLEDIEEEQERIFHATAPQPVAQWASAIAHHYRTAQRPSHVATDVHGINEIENELDQQS